MVIPPDLAYFVRRGEYNDELRFSLRSVDAFLPHERVWVVGHAPSWTRELTVVPGNKKSTKWENVTDNLRIACREIPADWLTVMNDDFFLTRPVADLPHLARAESLEEQASRVRPGLWKDSLLETLRLLRELGIRDPRSYELHVPVAMERRKLAEVVAIIQGSRPRRVPAQWRTVYGCLFVPEPEEAKDSKSRRARPPSETGFESSDDASFLFSLRPRLRLLLPDRCRYEEPRSPHAPPTSKKRRALARRARPFPGTRPAPRLGPQPRQEGSGRGG